MDIDERIEGQETRRRLDSMVAALRSAQEITYSISGYSAGETLLPVEDAEGRIAWQVTAASGALAGFWVPIVRQLGRLSSGTVGPFDWSKEWTVVEASGGHLRILADLLAPHKGGDTTLYLDGAPYHGDYGAGYHARLVPGRA